MQRFNIHGLFVVYFVESKLDSKEMLLKDMIKEVLDLFEDVT